MSFIVYVTKIVRCDIQYRTTEYLFCVNYFLIHGTKKKKIHNVVYFINWLYRKSLQMNIIKHIFLIVNYSKNL